MSSQRVLYIAILAHNALAYTQQCLHSLLANSTTPIKIWILDNGSDDETWAWLSQRWATNVNALHSPVNVGVPGGRNMLLNKILPQTDPEDFIVFLDNDVEVHPAWDQAFLSCFAQNPSAAIVGVTGHNIVVRDGRRTLLPSPEQGPKEVDVVSGYCLWVSTLAAASLGPFDENLGRFWHEDDDYCVRAIWGGYSVFCLPAAGVTHHRHKSGVAELELEVDKSDQNQAYLAEKWEMLGLIDPNGRIIRAGRDLSPAERTNERT
jgi:GT2 family glycosyltransferase